MMETEGFTTKATNQTNEGESTEIEGVTKEWSLQDFEIGNILGGGKFGKVYIARERKTHFIVAIKVLSKSRLHRYKAEGQLRREIEILCHVRSLNITRLFCWFHDKDRVYLVLEYCSGGDVFAALREKEQFTERQTANYIADLAKTLIYCRSKHIIHRDLKPENLLLDQDGTIKLADFGWSVHNPDNDRRKTLCGTADYLAPEVVAKRSYDGQIDNWALGVLMYEFLCGKPPFDDEKESQRFDKIRNVRLVFPGTVSNDARDLIKKLMKKNPAERLPLDQVEKHPFITRYRTTKK